MTFDLCCCCAEMGGAGRGGGSGGGREGDDEATFSRSTEKIKCNQHNYNRLITYVHTHTPWGKTSFMQQ